MISKLIEDYRELYERAKKAAPESEDGSVSEDDVLLQLKRIVPFDEDAARERKSKQIIDALCKEDRSKGQLCFPGFGTWDWEPLRLIRSEDGRLLENYKATLKFKMADAQRSGKHVEEVQASYRRKQYESDIFTTWTVDRLAAGAKPEELTWGACVEALGLLDPLAPSGQTDED